MKKVLYITLFTTALFLTGCASKPASINQNKTDTENQEDNIKAISEPVAENNQTENNDDLTAENIQNNNSEASEENNPVSENSSAPEELEKLNDEVELIEEVLPSPEESIKEEQIDENGDLTADENQDSGVKEIPIESVEAGQDESESVQPENTISDSDNISEQPSEAPASVAELPVLPEENISEPKAEAVPVEETLIPPAIKEPEASEKTSEALTETPAVENTENKTEISEPLEITDDEDSEKKADVKNAALQITPSRKVEMKVTEYLDVTYPGKGWIYLGATDNSKNIIYQGRKLGTEDTVFTLQSRIPGTKILHFCKNDSLSQEILDDYLEVKVTEERGSNSNHIKAPAFKMPVKTRNKPVQIVKPVSSVNTTENQTAASDTKTDKNTEIQQASVDENKKEASESSNNYSANTSVNDIQPVNTESENPSQKENSNILAETNTAASNEQSLEGNLLENAQKYYEAGDYENALKNVNEHLGKTAENTDYALYLKGQILEAKWSGKDILKAIESYQKLIKNYPSSKYWDNANKRIIYLKRLYLQAR